MRRAAEESFVLLRNAAIDSKAVLPLGDQVKSVALIGPLADAANEMQVAWGGATQASDVVTLRQALQRRMQQRDGRVLFAHGTDVLGDSTAGFDAALQAARQADVVVMALGESSEMSGEAGSRAHLNLPGNQQELLVPVPGSKDAVTYSIIW